MPPAVGPIKEPYTSAGLDPARGRGARALLSGAAVLFALASTVWAAWEQGFTYDEPFHLQWSERLLQSGVTERESQERFNSKTPVMVPGAMLRLRLQRASVTDPRVLRLAARLPSICWLAGILAGTFLLGRRVFGPEAAHLATLATALDPNLMAHGSLATVDAAYACAALLTTAAALRLAEAPSARRGLVAGLALGLALATKFTAVLLLPTVLLALVPIRLHDREAIVKERERRWTNRVLAALAAAAAAAAVVCAAYFFIDVGLPLGQLAWRSAAFNTLAETMPGLRLPLPAAFLTGVDYSLATERADWNVVVLGRLHPHGVWFYFVLLWLVKTPLLVLVAQVAGLAKAVVSRALATPGALLIGLTFVVHLAYFSLLFRAQVGYRFVLACVPLGYLLASAGLARLLHGRAGRVLLPLAVAAAVLEDATYLGNPISFTNAAVWPKAQAFRIAADSNLDWGQNRERADELLEKGGAGPTHLDPPHFVPGHNTFGVNVLSGVWDFEKHRFLREHARPKGHFGHTFVWFDVDHELFDELLSAERRLVVTPDATAACPGDLPYERLDAGSQSPFSVAGTGPLESWIVCLSTRRGTDLGLRAETGQMKLGRYHPPATCEKEEVVGKGQVVWYRLDPGVHALCATEMPNRREWIPRPFEGQWLARGRGAAIHLRESGNLRAPTPPPPAGTTLRSSSPPPPP